MSPALSLAQSAHDDEGTLVSTAARIRELEDMLLVTRREAEESAARVVRLTAGLEQASAVALATEPRDSNPVPNLVVRFSLNTIHAVCQAALEET